MGSPSATDNLDSESTTLFAYPPSLSAYASLLGNFNFNRTALAPPGTKIVAHVSADTRTTFGEHGKVGWYVGPSPEHYRCYRCYFPDTMQERDVLKVDFFPEKILFPTFTHQKYLQQTAEDMLYLLHPSASSNLDAPLSYGPPILNAFAKVAAILGRAMSKPLTVHTPTAPAVPASQAVVSPPRVHPSKSLFPVSPRQTRSTTALRDRPRLFRSHRAPSYLAQSIQHDPSVAGKMYNPATGRAETIDSLLRGPDRLIWLHSLTNEWARCTPGLSKKRSPCDCIVGNCTMFFICPHKVPPGCLCQFCLHHAPWQS
jgi:hypothetical protein